METEDQMVKGRGKAGKGRNGRMGRKRKEKIKMRKRGIIEEEMVYGGRENRPSDRANYLSFS